MKESDYILVTNLQLLRVVERTLRDVHDFSSEHLDMVRHVRERIEKLERKINGKVAA